MSDVADPDVALDPQPLESARRPARTGAKWDMALVFAVALGVRLVWAALIPPALAPDEVAHFTYVTHIVENGSLPNPDTLDSRYPFNAPEAEQLCTETFCSGVSGLGAGPRTLSWLPLNHDYAKAREFSLPPAKRKTSGGASAGIYPPLYYLYTAIFYAAAHSASAIDRVLAVRAATAALSALCAVFAYLFAYELRRDRLWGRCLGLSAALMPMHAFIGSSVNNDAGLFASTAALSWLAVRVWCVPAMTSGLAAWLGLAAGCALLSKPTSAPTVALGSLALVLRLWRDGRRRELALPKIAQTLAAFAGALCVTEGAWLLYRRVSGVSTMVRTGPTILDVMLGQASHSLAEYVADLVARGIGYYDWLFVATYWGMFGWLELGMSEFAYRAIKVALLAGFVGTIGKVALRSEQRWITVAIMFSIPLNAWLLFMAADYAISFAATGRPFGMQGRYFYGTMLPLLFIIVTGCSFLARGRPFVLRMIPLAMLALHGAALRLILRVYYSVGLP